MKRISYALLLLACACPRVHAQVNPMNIPTEAAVPLRDEGKMPSSVRLTGKTLAGDVVPDDSSVT